MRIRDEMPELDGATDYYNIDPIKKANLVGDKPTLIHFWSVSCELCKNAMPNINEFRDEYKDELNVVSVHMPRSEKDLELEQIQEVAAEHDITQPILVDNTHAITDAFNNEHVPAYYVFDKDGQLRHRQAGDGGMKMLRKRVDRVLEK